MTQQQIAEKYMREKLPELSFTVVCRVSEKHPTGVRKTCRKPQLQHWLRVLARFDLHFQYDETKLMVRRGFGIKREPTDYMTFDFITGQPATEEDFQKFNQIVEAGEVIS